MWEGATTSLIDAFNTIGVRVKSEAENQYFLTYCSPSRAGTSVFSLSLLLPSVTFAAGSLTSLSYSFTANGFTGACNSFSLANPCQQKCAFVNGVYCGS